MLAMVAHRASHIHLCTIVHVLLALVVIVTANADGDWKPQQEHGNHGGTHNVLSCPSSQVIDGDVTDVAPKASSARVGSLAATRKVAVARAANGTGQLKHNTLATIA